VSLPSVGDDRALHPRRRHHDPRRHEPLGATRPQHRQPIAAADARASDEAKTAQAITASGRWRSGWKRWPRPSARPGRAGFAD
jgi:hypothetical protein